jgi:hypothetical protein
MAVTILEIGAVMAAFPLQVVRTPIQPMPHFLVMELCMPIIKPYEKTTPRIQHQRTASNTQAIDNNLQMQNQRYRRVGICAGGIS